MHVSTRQIIYRLKVDLIISHSVICSSTRVVNARHIKISKRSSLKQLVVRQYLTVLISAVTFECLKIRK